jgi:hypothetical protein
MLAFTGEISTFLVHLLGERRFIHYQLNRVQHECGSDSKA